MKALTAKQIAFPDSNMAPVTLSKIDGKQLSLPHDSHEELRLIRIPDELKEAVQHLFEIQSAVHGYLGPETQQELVRKMFVSIPFPP